MRLHIDQPPCPRDRRVIRRLLVEPDSQKSPQPERIRRSPSDPALRIDSFKIPNQQQPKIDPRHQRGPPVVCGVKLRALPLGERIELSLFQQFIHSLVERMAWPLRQFIVADPQPLLPLSAPSCPHRHRGFSRLRWHSTRTSDLRKLCSATNKQKTDFHHRLLGENREGGTSKILEVVLSEQTQRNMDIFLFDYDGPGRHAQEDLQVLQQDAMLLEPKL